MLLLANRPLVLAQLFASVQLFFAELLGERIPQTHTKVQKWPLVVERERINFLN